MAVSSSSKSSSKTSSSGRISGVVYSSSGVAKSYSGSGGSISIGSKSDTSAARSSAGVTGISGSSSSTRSSGGGGGGSSSTPSVAAPVIQPITVKQETSTQPSIIIAGAGQSIAPKPGEKGSGINVITRASGQVEYVSQNTGKTTIISGPTPTIQTGSVSVAPKLGLATTTPEAPKIIKEEVPNFAKDFGITGGPQSMKEGGYTLSTGEKVGDYSLAVADAKKIAGVSGTITTTPTVEKPAVFSFSGGGTSQKPSGGASSGKIQDILGAPGGQSIMPTFTTPAVEAPKVVTIKKEETSPFLVFGPKATTEDYAKSDEISLNQKLDMIRADITKETTKSPFEQDKSKINALISQRENLNLFLESKYGGPKSMLNIKDLETGEIKASPQKEVRTAFEDTYLTRKQSALTQTDAGTITASEAQRYLEEYKRKESKGLTNVADDTLLRNIATSLSDQMVGAPKQDQQRNKKVVETIFLTLASDKKQQEAQQKANEINIVTNLLSNKIDNFNKRDEAVTTEINTFTTVTEPKLETLKQKYLSAADMANARQDEQSYMNYLQAEKEYNDYFEQYKSKSVDINKKISQLQIESKDIEKEAKTLETKQKDLITYSQALGQTKNYMDLASERNKTDWQKALSYQTELGMGPDRTPMERLKGLGGMAAAGTGSAGLNAFKGLVVNPFREAKEDFTEKGTLGGLKEVGTGGYLKYVAKGIYDWDDKSNKGFTWKENVDWDAVKGVATAVSVTPPVLISAGLGKQALLVGGFVAGGVVGANVGKYIGYKYASEEEKAIIRDRETFKQGMRAGFAAEDRAVSEKGFIKEIGYGFLPNIWNEREASKQAVKKFYEEKGYTGSQLDAAVRASMRQREAGMAGGTVGSFAANLSTELLGRKLLSKTATSVFGGQVGNLSRLKLVGQAMYTTGKLGMLEGAGIYTAQQQYKYQDFKGADLGKYMAYGTGSAALMGGVLSSTGILARTAKTGVRRGVSALGEKAVEWGSYITDPMELVGDVAAEGVEKGSKYIPTQTIMPTATRTTTKGPSTKIDYGVALQTGSPRSTTITDFISGYGKVTTNVELGPSGKATVSIGKAPGGRAITIGGKTTTQVTAPGSQVKIGTNVEMPTGSLVQIQETTQQKSKRRASYGPAVRSGTNVAVEEKVRAYTETLRAPSTRTIQRTKLDQLTKISPFTRSDIFTAPRTETNVNIRPKVTVPVNVQTQIPVQIQTQPQTQTQTQTQTSINTATGLPLMGLGSLGRYRGSKTGSGTYGWLVSNKIATWGEDFFATRKGMTPQQQTSNIYSQVTGVPITMPKAVTEKETFGSKYKQSSDLVNRMVKMNRLTSSKI